MTDETIEPSLAESRSEEHTPTPWTTGKVNRHLIWGPQSEFVAEARDAANAKLIVAAVNAQTGVTSPDYVMVSASVLWDALKRECAATKPDSPEWDKVATLVTVRREHVERALLAAAPPSPRLTPSEHGSSAALRAQVIEECAKVAERPASPYEPTVVWTYRERIATAIRSLSAVSAIAQERDVGKKIGYQWVYRQKDGSLELGSADINDADDPPYAAEFSELVGKAEIILLSSPTTSPSAISEAPTSAEAVSTTWPANGTTPTPTEELEALIAIADGHLAANPGALNEPEGAMLRQAIDALIALDAERGRMREALAAVVKVHDHEDPFDAAHVSEFNRAMEIARSASDEGN